jgi:peptide/nickel transport system permease protein
MIFQEPGRSFDPLQRIGAVFFETLRNRDPGIGRPEADKRAAVLLEETGIAGAKERLGGFPHQFSGGQLQRIGIALALAQGCGLLIADEPTTALDVTIQAQIIALLKRLRDERGIGIIFISHNIDAALAISDRILVLYGGIALESGTAGEVLTYPRHPYTKALLGAAPQFGRTYREGRLLTIPGKVPDPRYPEPLCPFAPRCSQAACHNHPQPPPPHNPTETHWSACEGG